MTYTITRSEWTISDIERIDEDRAILIAEEKIIVKDHDVYFVDFGGYFGYSALVFKNGHHIYYANDYELHHAGKTRAELREWYINGLNNKLFTEEEISTPLTDYDEYSRKEYFLHNYYGMREDYISMFHIFHNDEEEKEFSEKTASMVFNPVCFCYHHDADFVQHCVDLFAKLEAAKEDTVNNFEYQKNAFFREMCNHEYGINWQADYDTLSAFGRIEWRGEDGNSLAKWFDDLGFNDIQRKAYAAARREYYREAEKNEWF